MIYDIVSIGNRRGINGLMRNLKCPSAGIKHIMRNLNTMEYVMASFLNFYPSVSKMPG